MGNTNLKWGSSAAILGAVLSLTPGEARAQNAESSASEDTIIVTAQRREQRLQDVPFAINAIDGEALQERGIQNLQDLGGRTPGVYFQNINAAAPQIYIRGIGTQQYDNSAEPPVGVFVDEVPAVGFASVPSELFDVARIEVLRGPQGTLYGRNTIGGAINIVTNAPTRDFEAQAQADIGNYDLVRIRGAVSGPLTETLSARFSFVNSDRSNFSKNPVTGHGGNNDNSNAQRLRLEWKPTDRLVFDASIERSINDLAGAELKIRGTTNVGGLFVQSDPAPDAPYTTFSNEDGHQKRKLWNGSLRATYSFDGFDFTSITAYHWHDLDALRDLDSGPAPFIAMLELERGDQFTQELRLASTNQGSFRWLLGGFFYTSAYDRTETWEIGAFPHADLSAAFGLPSGSLFADYFNGRYDWTMNTKARSYALFGQVEFDLTSQVSIVAGLRYSKDRKEGSYSTASNAIVPFPAFLTTYSTNVERSWDSLDPAVTLNFQPNEDVLLYASFKQGYKSGGFQLRPPRAILAQTPYDPERVNAYEFGVKSQWLDRRITANLSVFHYDYEGLQVLGVTPGLPISLINNAASAKIDGAELELLARPNSRAELGISYAYLDARYGDYPEPAQPAPIQRKGNRLSRSPEHSVNAFAQYTLPIKDAGSVSFRLDYNWRSEIFFAANNTAVNRDGSVGLLNARLTYASPDDRWSLAAWATNLTKEVYCASNVPSVPSETASTCVVGAPRQVGATLTWKFK